MSPTKVICDSGEQYLRDLTKSFKGMSTPLKNAKSPDTMDDLVKELHYVFSSDRVDIEYVNHLLLSYQSSGRDWEKFVNFNPNKYTRNLVDAGNGKFNLLIICWDAGQGSAIHDHTESHCFMRILQGQLREIRYVFPDDYNNNNNNNNVELDQSAHISATHSDDEHEVEYNSSELQELSSCIMETGSLHYINDTLGLHRVENPNPTVGAISLHLYCPPYDTCSIFNQKTGEQTKCRIDHYDK